jgi:predicted nucleotidyltransferase
MLTIDRIKKTVTDYFIDKPVKTVYLFGSYARGDAKEDSDVDIVFEFSGSPRMSYFGLARYVVDLEKMLSSKVDLVNGQLLHPRIKEYVEADKILLFSKL